MRRCRRCNSPPGYTLRGRGRPLTAQVTAAIIVGVAILIVQAVPAYAEAACKDTTPAFLSMPRGTLRLVDDAGAVHEVSARVAATARQRAGGFQHLCPQIIDNQLLVFVFPRAAAVRFHMRNVYAPLDIAFVDADGRLVDIQRMEPGRRLYASPAPVRFALESRAGFFAAHGISAVSGRLIVDSVPASSRD